MIDLGLSKMALIGVIALIVIGPKDLPKVARMAGSLLGRAQRYINEVKSEVSREMELDELRKMQSEVETAAQEVEHSISAGFSETEALVNSNPSDWDASPVNSQALTYAQKQKQKNFRRKKLARNSALPGWYKNLNGNRSQLSSGSARMARHRVSPKAPSSFY